MLSPRPYQNAISTRKLIYFSQNFEYASLWSFGMGKWRHVFIEITFVIIVVIYTNYVQYWPKTNTNYHGQF